MKKGETAGNIVTLLHRASLCPVAWVWCVGEREATDDDKLRREQVDTAYMLLQVQVPDGLNPGDTMMVGHGGQEFAITVPDGVHGGCLLDVDLPVDDNLSCAPPTQLPSPSSVIVAIPGMSAGDQTRHLNIPALLF